MDAMESYVQFSSKLSGRDKIFRLIQYSAKFISNYSKEATGLNDDYVKRLKSLESALSMSRKTFRIGKSVDMVYSTIKATEIKDPVISSLIVCSKVSRICYFFYDTVNWLIKAGVLTGDAKKSALKSSMFWFLTLSSCLMRDLYELKKYIVNQNKTKIKNSNNENSVLEFISLNIQVIFDMIRNLFDLILALKMLNKLDISDSAAGLVGMISSIVGLVELVYPYYKLTPS